MKKKILAILLCGGIILTAGGCNKKNKVAKADLESINEKIIDYFQTNGTKDYENFAFNYVDEENKVVVVGLLNNNLEEQNRFKKEIVDSLYIKFVQGEKSVNVDNEENCPIEDAKPFIRTYNVLHIAPSNDEKYIYLTIRQFQEEEVQTVKVEKNLCPDIATGKNYEFTIKPIYQIEDNIASIFNHSEILSIEKTEKIGLDQIQENISLN